MIGSNLAVRDKIAYFSMEIGLKREIPTYSGGLGILSGDSIKAAADLGIPMNAITLMYNKGNFEQRLENDGWQQERDIPWSPERHMRKLDEDVQIELYGQPVKAKVWQYDVQGEKGVVPVYFLDANTIQNPAHIRATTNHVYGGDVSNRIFQEALLGIGGVRLLEKLGIPVCKYHMNEGHSAFLITELMKKKSLDNIIDSCVFTTHTPVEAGLEKFDYWRVEEILRDQLPKNIKKLAGNEKLNMTTLALNSSSYANAVARKHGEVSRKLFGKEIDHIIIDHITNGVHSATWTSNSFMNLFDKYCEGWRQDAEKLSRGKNIPLSEIWDSHMVEKRRLIDYVNLSTGRDLNPDLLTVGFARRVAKYKRADLILEDINELARIAGGKLQLVFAGKTHPNDEPAKHLLKDLFSSMQYLDDSIKCVYIEDYNMDLGKLLTSGCDIWLNNPVVPLEASGTSGMKAAHNGVPHFSTIDGWWAEGHKEGVTGWAIGEEKPDNKPIHLDSQEAAKARKADSFSLYEKLENNILPAYYSNGKKKFKEIMRNSIAINAAYFNTHRMMKEYAKKAYKIEI
ncbi:MAG: alpha-glucan family phosphorylase [archaeon]